MAPVHVPTLEKPSPWYLFTQFTNSTCIVSRIIGLKSFDIHDTSFPHAPYKLLPSIKNVLGTRCLFLSTFIFIALFCGLAGACMNLESIFSNSLFMHSLSNNHSFLNGFQPNLCQHFSHVCSIYLSYYFQPKENT